MTDKDCPLWSMSAANTCLLLNACTHLATFNMVRHNHPMLHLALLGIPMNFCHVNLLFTYTQAIPLYGLSFLNKGANIIIFTHYIHMHTRTHTPSTGNTYLYKEWYFICIMFHFQQCYIFGQKEYIPWLTQWITRYFNEEQSQWKDKRTLYGEIKRRKRYAISDIL
jgi:hypothetical protein